MLIIITKIYFFMVFIYSLKTYSGISVLSFLVRYPSSHISGLLELLISKQQLADSSQCLTDCYLSSCKVFIRREISGICPLPRPGKLGRYLLCGIIGGQNGIVNLSQELSPLLSSPLLLITNTITCIPRH